MKNSRRRQPGKREDKRKKERLSLLQPDTIQVGRRQSRSRQGEKRNSFTPFKCLSIQEVRQELAVSGLDSIGDSKVCRERLAEHL